MVNYSAREILKEMSKDWVLWVGIFSIVSFVFLFIIGTEFFSRVFKVIVISIWLFNLYLTYNRAKRKIMDRRYAAARALELPAYYNDIEQAVERSGLNDNVNKMISEMENKYN